MDFIDQPEPHTVNIFVQIDPATVSFRKEGGRWKAELDIIYIQKDQQGKMQGDGITETATLALTDESFAKVVQHGLIHQRRFPRQPAASTLRIVVRDADSGSIGSVTVPFSQVPQI